jgi:hypothetical protein
MTPTERTAYLPGGALLRIAGNLRCPHCNRVMQPYDFESLDAGEFELNCAGCHRTTISCKPVG